MTSVSSPSGSIRSSYAPPEQTENRRTTVTRLIDDLKKLGRILDLPQTRLAQFDRKLDNILPSPAARKMIYGRLQELSEKSESERVFVEAFINNIEYLNRSFEPDKMIIDKFLSVNAETESARAAWNKHLKPLIRLTSGVAATIGIPLSIALVNPNTAILTTFLSLIGTAGFGIMIHQAIQDLPPAIGQRPAQYAREMSKIITDQAVKRGASESASERERTPELATQEMRKRFRLRALEILYNGTDLPDRMTREYRKLFKLSQGAALKGVSPEEANDTLKRYEEKQKKTYAKYPERAVNLTEELGHILKNVNPEAYEIMERLSKNKPISVTLRKKISALFPKYEKLLHFRERALKIRDIINGTKDTTVTRLVKRSDFVRIQELSTALPISASVEKIEKILQTYEKKISHVVARRNLMERAGELLSLDLTEEEGLLSYPAWKKAHKPPLPSSLSEAYFGLSNICAGNMPNNRYKPIGSLEIRSVDRYLKKTEAMLTKKAAELNIFRKRANELLDEISEQNISLSEATFKQLQDISAEETTLSHQERHEYLKRTETVIENMQSAGNFLKKAGELNESASPLTETETVRLKNILAGKETDHTEKYDPTRTQKYLSLVQKKFNNMETALKFLKEKDSICLTEEEIQDLENIKNGVMHDNPDRNIKDEPIKTARYLKAIVKKIENIETARTLLKETLLKPEERRKLENIKNGKDPNNPGQPISANEEYAKIIAEELMIIKYPVTQAHIASKLLDALSDDKTPLTPAEYENLISISTRETTKSPEDVQKDLHKAEEKIKEAKKKAEERNLLNSPD